MLEPIILPKMMAFFPLFAAAIDVTNSGREVPIAITDKPINESGIFKLSDSLIADSTEILTPNNVKIIDTTTIGKPKTTGFSYENFDRISKLISESTSLFLIEFLKL